MADNDYFNEAGRGREATLPQHIPAAGWKDVVARSWDEISENNIFLVAGGVTYAILLALFPGLTALVSLYGLLFDPGQIEQQVDSLAGVLPEQSLQLLSQELHQLASAPSKALGFGAIVGLLIAFWSASRGMSGLITAMNIAYEEKERRGFIKVNLLAFGMTFAAIVGGIVVVSLVAILPAMVQFVGLGAFAKWLILVLEWPLLLAVLLLGMAMLFRYGPDRNPAQWHWVSPGAIVGAVLWILGSIGFSVYVANFNSYDKTYGSLGGAVILLTWLYLSSLVLLLGAVINAQAERQTREDTTEGPPKPMGERNAHAADTLGPSTGGASAAASSTGASSTG
jgi:membrane protein